MKTFTAFNLIGVLLICLVMTSTVFCWPKAYGVYTAKSSALIPAFPRTLSEFRTAGRNKDYWDESFDTKGTLRVFEGEDWTEIYTGETVFPHTMNKCSDGVFMIRWRSANPSVRIATSVGNNTEVLSDSKVSSYGYIYGTNCEQPYFKFNGVSRGNGATLADVYYDIKFWQAAP